MLVIRNKDPLLDIGDYTVHEYMYYTSILYQDAKVIYIFKLDRYSFPHTFKYNRLGVNY